MRSEANTRSRAGVPLAITFVLLAQVMFVVDGTIVNIALPTMQEDLGFTASGLTWVINAYALAFGGLMLVSGKVAGMIGPRRALIIGVALFVLASIGGGFATTPELLILARACQGMAAAVASPSGFMLIMSNTAAGRQRARALSLTLVASACGGAAGLLAGGVLTTMYGWQAVMFVNVPIGAAILLGAKLFIREGDRHPARLDFVGAILSTVFMVSLVYALTTGSSESWLSSWVIGTAAVAVIAFAALWLFERRKTDPVVPFSALSPKTNGPLFATSFFLSAGMSTYLFFLTLYTQQILGYEPIGTAILLLPFLVAQILASQIGPFLARPLGERLVGSLGLAMLTFGQVWLSFLGAGLDPVFAIILPTVLMGVGAGFAYPQVLGAILQTTHHSKLGTTSSLINTAANLGGSVGIAVLAGVSVVVGNAAGQSTGLSAGMLGAAGFMVVAFTIFMVRARRFTPRYAEPPMITTATATIVSIGDDQYCSPS